MASGWTAMASPLSRSRPSRYGQYDPGWPIRIPSVQSSEGRATHRGCVLELARGTPANGLNGEQVKRTTDRRWTCRQQ
jgi:hypothetical protein